MASRVSAVPRTALTRAVRRWRSFGSRPARIDIDDPGGNLPPPTSAMSAAARSDARAARSGSIPRSNLSDASEISPSRRLVRLVEEALKHAASRRMSVVASETSVVSPPITPASAIGPDGSVMRSVSVASDPVLAVERSDGLAFGGGTNDDGGLAVALRDGAHVEGMERLAELVHHVVGHVDDVVDRPRARRNDPLGQPRRRRTDRDAPDDPSRVSRAQSGVHDLHAHEVRGRRTGLLRSARGHAVGRPRDRRDLTRHAHHRQAVGAVRSHLQLEHRVADAVVLGERRAHRGVGGQHQQAARVATHAKLGGRAHHALGDESAELGLLDAHAVGEGRPHACHRHLVAGLEVGRPAHDVERLGPADVHRAVRRACRHRGAGLS